MASDTRPVAVRWGSINSYTLYLYL